jgi:hypothetical protein
MDHVVKVQREITAATPIRSRNGLRIATAIVCVTLIGFCVFSWVARPEFIWGPGAQPMPPAQQEASLRFGMFVLSQRIEADRAARGAYPASLGAFGARAAGVRYRVLSDSAFELRAAANGRPVILRSNESMDVFLGNSPMLIKARP